MSGYCVFDIETGPEEPAVVWGRTGMDALPPLPRPFDESEVKVGHLKDPAKIAEKVRISRGLHEQAEALAVLDHPAELMQAIDKAALDPMTGRVFAFGVLIVNESGALSIGIEDVTSMSESQLLNVFWGVYQANVKSGRRMIGHNIFEFDLPFLVRRSWALDVDVPQHVMELGSIGRVFWSPMFLDTMRYFGLGAYGKDSFVGLGRLGEFFGVGRKNGSGAEFASLLQSDREAAHRYLENDLALCHRVAARMGLC